MYTHAVSAIVDSSLHYLFAVCIFNQCQSFSSHAPAKHSTTLDVQPAQVSKHLGSWTWCLSFDQAFFNPDVYVRSQNPAQLGKHSLLL